MELPAQLTAFTNVLIKLPQKKIANALSVLLLVYIANLLAQTTWIFAPTDEYVGKAKTSAHHVKQQSPTSAFTINELQALNLFGVYQTMEIEEVVEIKNAPETKLNLGLSATVASDDKNAAAAVIENKGSQETYGIGDEIIGTRATLTQIMADRVLIKHAGRIETLMLDGFDYQAISSEKANVPAKNSNTSAQNKNKNEIDKRQDKKLSDHAKTLRADIIKDPGKILDYLRISPKNKNGRTIGYMLRPGRKSEFFKSSGLKTGDVAVEINGLDLTQPMQAAEALVALRKESEVALRVKRGDSFTDILFSIGSQ
jgi:general secretion pathway protein C